MLDCFLKDARCVAAAAKQSGPGLCRLAYHKEDMVLVSQPSYTTFIRFPEDSVLQHSGEKTFDHLLAVQSAK